jgi:hypothetical protein
LINLKNLNRCFMKKIFVILPAFCLFLFASAQTTFDRVYGILQTNCTGYCHNAGNATGNLRFDGTKQEVLNNLVRVTPDNDYAEAMGFKRVVPGDARRSLLFRKVNRGLDSHISLHQDEGAPMPKNGNALSDVERELIRQWIIFGATDTGYHYVDEQTITDYYNGFAEQRDPSLPIPDPSEGMQIYFGPIFLRPGNEIEFDSKFPIYNAGEVEVYKMAAEVNKESHHMAIFKFLPGKDTLLPDGLKRVNGIGDAAELFDKAQPIGQWPDPLEIETPQGTALIWEPNTVLSLSYHILNYSDSIIMCEVYCNVFFRPRQPNTIPMLSYPVRYDGKPVYEGGWEVGNLILPPNAPGETTTLTITQINNPDTGFWYIWSLQAHTHQLGKSYNVWLRNPDGSKGTNIYDGNMDPTYTFNTGRFDWEHAPLHYFNPLQPVDMSNGLIHEASFYNNTPDTVGFGLRTTDEMYVTYVFYTKQLPSVGIRENRVFQSDRVRVYPNPVQHEAIISVSPDVSLADGVFTLYDLQGRQAVTLENITDKKFTFSTGGLTPGTYFYRLADKGVLIASGKIVTER